MSLSVINRPIGHKSNAITPAEDYPIVQTFGSLSPSGGWIGGSNSQTGDIYFCPHNSHQVLKIVPETRAISLFGNLPGSSKWAGLCRAQNGCLYGAPYSSSPVLKIDPLTDTVATFGSSTGIYIGAILAPNGKIYCIPYTATSVLKIDPDTDTVSTFGSFTAPAVFGAALAMDGKIYCMPDTSTQIFVIDPATDTVGTLGSFSAGNKCQGAIMADNNKIYSAPYTVNYTIELDVANQSTRQITTSNTRFFGACTAPNKKLYMPGELAARVMEFDTRKGIDRTVLITGPNQVSGWSGLVLAQNGKFYGAPYVSNRIIEISRVGQVTPDMYTMPNNIAGLATTEYNMFNNHF